MVRGMFFQVDRNPDEHDVACDDSAHVVGCRSDVILLRNAQPILKKRAPHRRQTLRTPWSARRTVLQLTVE